MIDQGGCPSGRSGIQVDAREGRRRRVIGTFATVFQGPAVMLATCVQDHRALLLTTLGLPGVAAAAIPGGRPRGLFGLIAEA